MHSPAWCAASCGPRSNKYNWWGTQTSKTTSQNKAFLLELSIQVCQYSYGKLAHWHTADPPGLGFNSGLQSLPLHMRPHIQSPALQGEDHQSVLCKSPLQKFQASFFQKWVFLVGSLTLPFITGNASFVSMHKQSASFDFLCQHLWLARSFPSPSCRQIVWGRKKDKKLAPHHMANKWHSQAY